MHILIVLCYSISPERLCITLFMSINAEAFTYIHVHITPTETLLSPSTSISWEFLESGTMEKRAPDALIGTQYQSRSSSLASLLYHLLFTCNYSYVYNLYIPGLTWEFVFIDFRTITPRYSGVIPNMSGITLAFGLPIFLNSRQFSLKAALF